MIFTHCELRLHFQCLLTNTLPPSQAFPDRDRGLKGDLRTVNWRTVVPAPLLLTDSFHAFVGQDNVVVPCLCPECFTAQIDCM